MIHSPVGAGINRRKFPRRQFLRGVGVLVKGEYFVTEGVEIGEGGLSFTTPQEFPEGQLIVMNFQIPSGSFVSVIGEIRNFINTAQGPVAPKGLSFGEGPRVGVHGCAFKDLKFEHKREVRLYVSAR